MPVSTVRWIVVFGLAAGITPGAVRAQGPRYAPATPAPASSGSIRPESGQRGGGVVYGRQPRAVIAHAPLAITNPSTAAGPNADQQPPPHALEAAPSGPGIAGNLDPSDVTILGPLGGMTLDEAIDRAIRYNLDLRAKSFEIPQADADIINANLRPNPIFYADGQLVPYGQYSRARPGGQEQYDVNVSIPIDLSHKRQERTHLAVHTKRVIEAQFQNEIRLRIDEVYGAYVDVLTALQSVIYMQKNVETLTQLLFSTKALYEKAERTRADVSRIEIQLEHANIALFDGLEQLRSRRRTLGTLLNLPADTAENLEVRGTLRDHGPAPPSLDELIALALENRPDIAAFRLGIQSAEANVKLQKANRFADAYLLYQPYTYQNNQPFGLKSPTSWALGITIPLPLYNRNQGGILRAELNVAQSQIELALVERQLATEVQNALREYWVTLQMVQLSEEKVLPRAKQMRADTAKLFVKGELTAVEYELARRDFNDSVKQFLDAVARHRRSMLSLNTTVGKRILP